MQVVSCELLGAIREQVRLILTFIAHWIGKRLVPLKLTFFVLPAAHCDILLRLYDSFLGDRLTLD